MKCDLCYNKATIFSSPLGNPDELKLCNKCFAKIKAGQGQYEPRTGLIGVIIAIKWLGFRDWLRCSWVRHCLADEREVYEAKMGN